MFNLHTYKLDWQPQESCEECVQFTHIQIRLATGVVRHMTNMVGTHDHLVPEHSFANGQQDVN